MVTARVYNTVQLAKIDRQIITVEHGERKKVVRIPDYQVRLVVGGPFHRRGAIEGETACGEKIEPYQETLRGYLLDNCLCTAGCFSPHELRLGIAAMKNGRPEGRFFDTSDIGDDDTKPNLRPPRPKR